MTTETVTTLHSAPSTSGGTLRLRSPGGPIPEDCIYFLKPISKDSPIDELRKFYQENGYLWVKGVLPAEDVWKFRETYFGYLATPVF